MLRAMQLTRFSDLGLRVLMYLAHDERPQPITVAEIATQFQVPHNHLVKVVGRLAKLGWVRALRGRNGGLRLGAPADAIRLGEVLRGLEGERTVVDCDACLLDRRCGLQHALDHALAAFYATLDGYTLAEVAGDRRTATAIRNMHQRVLLATGEALQ